MNAPHPPPLYRWWTVGTRSGLLMYAYAASRELAMLRVHGAVAAWEGFGPGEPGNDNGRARAC